MEVNPRQRSYTGFGSCRRSTHPNQKEMGLRTMSRVLAKSSRVLHGGILQNSIIKDGTTKQTAPCVTQSFWVVPVLLPDSSDLNNAPAGRCFHCDGDVCFVLGAIGFGILLIICALLCDRMFCEMTSASRQELVLGVGGGNSLANSGKCMPRSIQFPVRQGGPSDCSFRFLQPLVSIGEGRGS